VIPVRAIGALALMLAATLLGVTPRGVAAGPSGLSPRYSAAGWLGVVQAAAGPDPSTVDALSIPPGAVVQWAGLHWGGDLAVRTDGTPPRCAAGSALATPPAAPDQLGTVALSINDSPPQTVSSAALSRITTPAGAPGYQAYADVTAMIRPYGGRTGTTLSTKISGLQVATGPGCTGGWDLLVVYAYPDGPDPKFAPIYQSMAVYDPLLAVGGSVSLTGMTTPKVGPVGSGATTSLLTAGAPVSLTLNGRPVEVSNADGNGYQPAATPLPNGTIAAGANTAMVTVSGTGDSFAATVIALGIGLPLTVNLPVTAAFSPTTVAVGAVAQLTLTVQNSGDVPDPGVAVTAPLPAGVTVVTDNSSYDPDSGVWRVGTVPPHATASLILTVRVNAPGSFSSSARVSASAISVGQSPPPAPITATIVAETVTVPPTDDGGAGITQPASLGQPGSSSIDLPPGGVLFGIGLFGVGLVLLLTLVSRRRSSGP
jgi:uncharacterized repeat protein (TIGR01451 family)